MARFLSGPVAEAVKPGIVAAAEGSATALVWVFAVTAEAAGGRSFAGAGRRKVLKAGKFSSPGR
jgi:hypothetical protein